jgi:phasin family protein
MADQNSNSPWPNLDVGELLKQFQIPGVDLNKWAESQRENIKALQDANQTAVQGWQNLMTRQAEILRESLEAWQQAVADGAASEPGEVAQKQLELGQKAFGKALSNMRELAEMAIKSQTEAADIIRKRVEQNLRDLQNR